MNRTLITKHLPMALIIASTLILCFKSPYSASDMEIVPDSVEYCSGAYNILTHGAYRIDIGTESLPPRYPPWFSLFFILPAYVIAPFSFGAPIIVILLMALFAVYTAYRIGTTVSFTAGGVLAAAFLLFLPVFRQSATEIMTDIPCTALCLAAAAIYLRLPARSSAFYFLLAGLTCSAAAGLRPLTIFMCLPFLAHLVMTRPAGLVKKTACLFLPLLPVISATMLYNRITFGSFFRNGYNYWCAVPYDYPALTFSLEFASMNLAVLLLNTMFILPVFLILLLLLFKKNEDLLNQQNSRAAISRLLIFLLIGTGPLTLAHIFYFFPEPRFFLPPLAIIAAGTGAMAGSITSTKGRSKAVFFAVILLLASILIRVNTDPKVPTRRNMVEEIRKAVPDHAVLISAIDPAYLSLMLKDRAIQFLPVSRTVEYASKVMSPTKLLDPDPYPAHCLEHRAEAVLKAGIDPVKATADEMMDTIELQIKQDRVFVLETGHITELEYPAVEKLLTRFPTRKISRDLYRLGPPSAKSSDPADSKAVEAL
jgi:hypothetical protein